MQSGTLLENIGEKTFKVKFSTAEEFLASHKNITTADAFVNQLCTDIALKIGNQPKKTLQGLIFTAESGSDIDYNSSSIHSLHETYTKTKEVLGRSEFKYKLGTKDESQALGYIIEIPEGLSTAEIEEKTALDAQKQAIETEKQSELEAQKLTTQNLALIEKLLDAANVSSCYNEFTSQFCIQHNVKYKIFNHKLEAVGFYETMHKIVSDKRQDALRNNLKVLQSKTHEELLENIWNEFPKNANQGPRNTFSDYQRIQDVRHADLDRNAQLIYDGNDFEGFNEQNDPELARAMAASLADLDRNAQLIDDEDEGFDQNEIMAAIAASIADPHRGNQQEVNGDANDRDLQQSLIFSISSTLNSTNDIFIQFNKHKDNLDNFKAALKDCISHDIQDTDEPVEKLCAALQHFASQNDDGKISEAQQESLMSNSRWRKFFGWILSCFSEAWQQRLGATDLVKEYEFKSQPLTFEHGR